MKQTADERDWYGRHRQETQHWGIFLIAVGAILTFGVHATVAGLDLHVIGWIFMLAGVAGLILFFYFWNRRRPCGPLGGNLAATTTPVSRRCDRNQEMLRRSPSGGRLMAAPGISRCVAGFAASPSLVARARLRRPMAGFVRDQTGYRVLMAA